MTTGNRRPLSFARRFTLRGPVLVLALALTTGCGGSSPTTPAADAAVVPVWNRSSLFAGAYRAEYRVDADSAQFSGFVAGADGSSGGAAIQASHVTVVDRRLGSGYITTITSSAASTGTARYGGSGGAYVLNRFDLLFDVEVNAVNISLLGACILDHSSLDIELSRVGSPGGYIFEYDLTSVEWERGECEKIQFTGSLPPGRYRYVVQQIVGATAWHADNTSHGVYNLTLQFSAP
jgi:hypothetical protein